MKDFDPHGEHYGAIFIEREKVFVAIGQLERSGNENTQHIVRLAEAELVVGDHAPDDLIYAATEKIVERTTSLQAIGIASYGPFVSLDPTNINEDRTTPYGLINRNRDGDPFRFSGSNLFDLVRSSLDECGYDPTALAVGIHTDATACAIGEALHRKYEAGRIMTYLYLTDGVGGATLSGVTPLPSSLHSEMGLLHVRLPTENEDPFVDERITHNEYHLGCVGDLLTTSSMLERARLLNLQADDFEDIARHNAGSLWEAPGFYLAQLCLACSSLIAPDCIMLGGPLAGMKGLRYSAFNQYRKLIDNRFSMQDLSLSDVETFILPASDVEEKIPLRGLDGCLQLGFFARLRYPGKVVAFDA